MAGEGLGGVDTVGVGGYALSMGEGRGVARRVGYFGSKATSGLCQALIAAMPPHDVYLETHLGGGAIMRRKPPALRNIGIDLDARVLESFRCDYPVELVHGCAHRFLAAFPFRGRELPNREIRNVVTPNGKAVDVQIGNRHLSIVDS